MNIKQGEIWLIEFFPKVGSEIAKQSPAVIVSADEIGILPLKTVVPITEWSLQYSSYPWMIKIENNIQNGLSKTSAVDCFQIKNFSHDRFINKIGQLDSDTIYKIHTTIAKTLNPLYRLE